MIKRVECPLTYSISLWVLFLTVAINEGLDLCLLQSSTLHFLLIFVRTEDMTLKV